MIWYSVMQPDGNRFCGDVVLDNFNKSRNEDHILVQIYKYMIIFMMILILYIIVRKWLQTQQ